jgi:hypothetical protein
VSKPQPIVPWWVIFPLAAIEGTGGAYGRASHQSACVEAIDKDSAMAVAKLITGRKPLSAHRLPYPAEPRLNPYSHGDAGPCPSFCYQPLKCGGHTSCPNRNGACSE